MGYQERDRLATKQTIENEAFDPCSLAIVTTVHYPKWYPGETNWEDSATLSDKTRGDSALEMINKAQGLGYQVFVVDSQASEIFTQNLNALEINRFAEKPGGMSAGRQQGFEEASNSSGVQYICWVEPEKISLLNFMLELVRPLARGEAEIVVPKRKVEEFIETYPDYQVASENKANRLWNNMLRKFGLLPKDSQNLDVWFGPKLFLNTPEVRRLFLAKYKYTNNEHLSAESNSAYRPDRYSNAIFFPIIAALSNGLRVASVEIPYKHPADQTKVEQNSEEFTKKRQSQLREIIRTCADYCRSLRRGSVSHTVISA